jgi:hypothetical protein
MLGHQTIARTPAIPANTRRASVSERLGANAAVPGRERLLGFVKQSLLAQLMLSMAFLVFASLIYLNQASKVDVLQFSISGLQQDQQTLLVQNANLHAQADKVTATLRITTLATSRLHMLSPDLQGTVFISPMVPAFKQPGTSGVYSARAKAQSSPLAWMFRAASWIGSQL